MYGRKNDSEKYRFGFNGKENDTEYGSSQLVQDYGFRIYNPSIARFLSTDPLGQNYPFYTPYQFAGNTPIQAIDLEGAEPRESTKADRQKVTNIIYNSGDVMDNMIRYNLYTISQRSDIAAATIVDQRAHPTLPGRRSKAMGFYGQAIGSKVIQQWREILIGTTTVGRSEIGYAKHSKATIDYMQLTIPLNHRADLIYSTVAVNPTTNEEERIRTTYKGGMIKPVLVELYEVKTTTTLQSTASSFVKAVSQLQSAVDKAEVFLSLDKDDKDKYVQAVPYVVLDKKQWNDLYEAYQEYELGERKGIYFGRENLAPKVGKAMEKLEEMEGGIIPIPNLTEEAIQLMNDLEHVSDQ